MEPLEPVVSATTSTVPVEKVPDSPVRQPIEEDEIPNELICTVCKDLLVNPVSPPCICGKSVCKDCWVTWVTKKLQKGRGNMVVCPCCGVKLLSSTSRLGELGVNFSLRFVLNCKYKELVEDRLKRREVEYIEQRKLDQARKEKLRQQRESLGPRETEGERLEREARGEYPPERKKAKTEQEPKPVELDREKWEVEHPNGYFVSTEDEWLKKYEEKAREEQEEENKKAAAVEKERIAALEEQARKDYELALKLSAEVDGGEDEDDDTTHVESDETYARRLQAELDADTDDINDL